MPWGQWWLRKVIRDRLRGKRRDRRPHAEADRPASERAPRGNEGNGQGTPTT